MLGVPTVSDRIAQTAWSRCGSSHGQSDLPSRDSYGYRPGKSALEAIAVTRRRCWDQDWVVEFDIRGLFDNLDHGLLMTALRKHCPGTLDPALRRALAESADAKRGGAASGARQEGTPQGGVVSPILAQSVSALRVRSLGDAASARRPVPPGTPTTPCFTARADVRRNTCLICASGNGSRPAISNCIRARHGSCIARTSIGPRKNPDIQFTFLRLHVPTPQGGGQVRPRLCELLAGRQPRRPQGDAANNSGMAGPTDERQEPG